MSQDKQTIRDALINVRGAFRTLAFYQKSMLSIVDYIKNRSGIKDARIYGAKRFSDRIRKCQLNEDYDANLNVRPNMWSWDFLYGYMFEYYLGKHNLPTNEGNQEVSVSILQISDDGFLTSKVENKKRPDINSFTPLEKSNSCLIICVGYGDGWYYVPQIMSKNSYSKTPWIDVALQTVNYIVDSSENTYINRHGIDENSCFFIAKKYPLELFFDKKNIDNILAELSNHLKQEAGLNLFNL